MTAHLQTLRHIQQQPLLAQLGLRVDHRKISIAQTAEERPIKVLEEGAVQERVDMLALSFLLFRFSFIGLYLADQANLRSLAWFAAFGSAIALFFA